MYTSPIPPRADDLPDAVVGDLLADQTRLGLQSHRLSLDHCGSLARRVVFAYPFHRNHQPIAPPGQGLDVLGFVGRITQRPPQVLDGRVDAVVKLDDGVVRPQFFSDLLAADQFALALDQHAQDLQGLLLQDRSVAVVAQLSARQVEFKDSNANADWLRLLHGTWGISGVVRKSNRSGR